MDFQIVDVFGDEIFKGNPVAVISGGETLSTQRMQDITRWLNLSETTFLLPPTDPRADYRVRIFTLDREMPFAGHPTLGTCHAWLTAGGRPRGAAIVQECGAGLVTVRKSGEGLAFAAPALIRSGPVGEPDLATALEVLRIDRASVVDARWVDNGPGWLGVLLESAQAVLALRPLGSYPRRIDIGVVGPHPAASPVDWELRAFFSNQNGGIVEDPITGSLNASVAQWLIGAGRAPDRYTAAQGTAIGRIGRVRVDRDQAGSVWIAGDTRTLFSGALCA
jgi:PhzF family phenazine biosynthesis protein